MREREYACDGKRHVMNFRLAGNKRRSSKDPHLKREREREREMETKNESIMFMISSEANPHIVINPRQQLLLLLLLLMLTYSSDSSEYIHSIPIDTRRSV